MARLIFPGLIPARQGSEGSLRPEDSAKGRLLTRDTEFRCGRAADSVQGRLHGDRATGNPPRLNPPPRNGGATRAADDRVPGRVIVSRSPPPRCRRRRRPRALISHKNIPRRDARASKQKIPPLPSSCPGSRDIRMCPNRMAETPPGAPVSRNSALGSHLESSRIDDDRFGRSFPWLVIAASIALDRELRIGSDFSIGTRRK